jgi:oxaloacetate decarboxylase alpha subunit
MLDWAPPQPSLAEIRRQFGRRLSDEELLLRYLIPEPDVDAMYAAAAPIEPVFPTTSGDLGWIGEVIARGGPQSVTARKGNVSVELRR